MHRIRNYFLAAALSISFVATTMAQHDDRRGQDNRRNYYGGMHDSVRRGDYGRYSRDDERRHHHDDGGGIGPGKAALIGGAGGAALGAIFGGGLKGTIIGGATGAGIGAIGGKLAQGNDHHHR